MPCCKLILLSAQVPSLHPKLSSAPIPVNTSPDSSVAPSPASPHFRSDLVRWQQLVTPDWLAGLMAGRAVAALPAQQWCLLEVGCGGLQAFSNAHLPNASYLDTQQLEGGPFWNKLADADLLQVLLGLGIRHDTTVILYGQNSAAAGRAAHLMLYAGVRDVRLLDGGRTAWQRAGWPLQAGPAAQSLPACSFGAVFPGCPQYLMDAAQVQSLLLQPGAALVSIRTLDEFSGKTSGYSYIAAKGDIAGARWGRAGDGSDVNSMSAFQWPDGTLRPAAEICAFWRDEGIRPDQQNTFYCGTGWRASLAFFYAWLMGWPQISVYDGGWLEWSSTVLLARRCSNASSDAM